LKKKEGKRKGFTTRVLSFSRFIQVGTLEKTQLKTGTRTAVNMKWRLKISHPIMHQ
jgi:hypothetical protein